jgi:hypothetical protein
MRHKLAFLHNNNVESDWDMPGNNGHYQLSAIKEINSTGKNKMFKVENVLYIFLYIVQVPFSQILVILGLRMIWMVPLCKLAKLGRSTGRVQEVFLNQPPRRDAPLVLKRLR